MNFVDDPKTYRSLAEMAIAKYGYAPEHNIDWYECFTDPNQKPVFVAWPDGTALLTHRDKKAWYVFSEPLVPPGEGGKRIIEFALHVLNSFSIKKVVLELRTPTRKEVLGFLPKSLRACRVNYTLIWPVMDMEHFDLTLSGGHWKSIRHAGNSFYREHQVQVLDTKNVDQRMLHDVVDTWQKARKGCDRPYRHHYHALIDRGFQGMRSARVILVDGKACGFNAGWEIPNEKCYYAAIGVHDYSLKDLGLMLYLEDLVWIKSAGYKKADMGGGERALTKFKNQFLPTAWYKSFVFSLVKNF